MAFLVEQAEERLVAAWQAERLGHAYLLTGPEGSGKTHLTRALAARILTTDTPESHPDFFVIRPESKSRRILIEQIRELENQLHQKSFSGGAKIAVIEQADRMQAAPANAFLKTLEEPPPGVHLFLITSAPALLLSTILSRCIEVELRRSGLAEPSEREREVSHMVRALLASQRDIGTIFRFTRRFQALLSEAREEILKSAKSEFAEESKALKNTTDGSWLKGREEQLEATAAGSALLERNRLLAAINRELAAQINPGDPTASLPLIRSMERVDTLRADLERNVQEALALEAGFLEAFRSLS
jgi:DNA polymerase-3 subunit delta'